MNKNELDRNARIYAGINKKDINSIKPIPKSELKVGRRYNGVCRNANMAEWNGETFVYDRYKFGFWFKEEINHFEDDDGYDVFVPFEEINDIIIR